MAALALKAVWMVVPTVLLLRRTCLRKIPVTVAAVVCSTPKAHAFPRRTRGCRPTCTFSNHPQIEAEEETAAALMVMVSNLQTVATPGSLRQLLTKATQTLCVGSCCPAFCPLTPFGCRRRRSPHCSAIHPPLSPLSIISTTMMTVATAPLFPGRRRRHPCFRPRWQRR